MRTALSLLALSIAASLPSYAATDSSTDNTENIERMVVTANRLPQLEASITAPLTIIDREQIVRSGANDLLAVLAMQPGIEISRNGGTGQTSSIFIRGTNSNQSVVLLNGVRLNDATTGTAQIGLLPLALIERVEIIRGARASVYGSDAIGGVINIISRPSSKAPAIELQAGIGSNERYFGGVRANAALTDSTQLYFLDYHDKSQGYDFFPASGLDEDYGYQNHTINIGLVQQFSPAWTGRVDTLFTRGEVEYNSAGAKVHSEPEKQIIDLAVAYQMDALFSELSFNAMQDKDQRFASDGSISSASETKRNQANWLAAWQFGQGWALQGGLEYKKDDVSGSSTPYEEDSRRNTAVHTGLLYSKGVVNAEGAVRYDDNSAYGDNVTYNLAGTWQLSQQWQLMLAHGTAFRAPTFNELYYPSSAWGGGNPDLKPEEASHYEFGATANYSLLAVSLNVYRNDIDNMISGWPPVNIAEARIEGLELAFDFDTAMVRHHILAEYLDPRDRTTDKLLVRRPQEKFVWQAEVEMDRWVYGAEWNWRGKSYNDADNTQQMDAYHLVNLMAQWQVQDAWRVSAKITNIFDEEYTSALGSPSWPDVEPYQGAERGFELSTAYQF